MREDWIEIELGTVCKYSKGKKPKLLNKEYSDTTPLPYINIKAFEKGIFDEYTDGTNCNLCEDGDLLMVWDGARAGFTGKAKKGVVGSTLMKMEPIEAIKKNYLFYFLLSLYKKINTNPRGVGIPHVEPSLLWASKIIYPSFPIQRAIVAKIEKLFSDIDNGVNNLKEAKEKLEIYRQAVLKKAFEGEWRKCIVGDKFDFIGGGTPSKSNPEYWNGEIPWCSVKDVKGDFLFKTKDSITHLGVIESATNIAEIDQVILITRISPGKTIIPKIKTAINQDLKIVLPKVKYGTKYIHYLFKKLELECVKKSSGTTVLGINLNNLKEIEIPDIPIMKQGEIIEFIETRLSICDNVLTTIDEALEKAEALRQSILKKAFEGELLNESELESCRKEADWEPADKLLERIKKEKGAVKK